jgi:RNA polymerase sigma factor (sigma-70 family)
MYHRPCDIREDVSTQFDADVALMIQGQGGDRQAYARLYERYAPTVRKYIAGHNGHTESQEDLVQEVFVRVWEHRERYRPGMAVGPYLLGFARNVCREHQVLASRDTQIGAQAPDPESTDLGPETTAQQNDQAERIRRLLVQLPSKQRQALELVYLRGLSSKQVSRLLGCSDRTIRINCRLGLQKLRRLVRDKPFNQ